MIGFYKENINSDDLKKYLQDILPIYMVPLAFVQVDSFIYTINGKIDRKETYNAFKERREMIKDDGYCGVEIEGDIINIIRSRLCGFAEIALDSDMSELGIDSLNWIRIVVDIEEKFNFEFEDEKLIISKFPKIRSLCDYVMKKNNY